MTEDPARGQGEFRTTQWTMVLEAKDGSTDASTAALSRLCRIYWRPIYHFIRFQGHNIHDAEDYTQGFFETLIGKNYLKTVEQDRGKFRSFLMTAIKHYLCNQYDRKRALKRGGKTPIISLDIDDAEKSFHAESTLHKEPEVAFDRTWAKTLLERTNKKLQQLYESRGKLDRYLALHPCLFGKGDQPYGELASRLSVTETVIKKEVSRMRQTFRQLFQQEVLETLSDTSDLDAEVAYLISLFE
ncbi:MAG: sigma-70 family RNA polymerase sigma factor [Verrucomicrobia bacterium]|jgi:RNA polymerase sigma factor (sigma-70 family)|nr:sigma-70 family RNA polymerase sigma factor [Verrucomicrobiota bacterium]